MFKFERGAVVSPSDFNAALKGWELVGIIHSSLEKSEKGMAVYESAEANQYINVTAAGCSCGCILLEDVIDLDGTELAIEAYECRCYEDECPDCEDPEFVPDILILGVQTGLFSEPDEEEAADMIDIAARIAEDGTVF